MQVQPFFHLRILDEVFVGKGGLDVEIATKRKDLFL
jgi:hypothetical protein